jgi:signal transduction histidine kinase
VSHLGSFVTAMSAGRRILPIGGRRRTIQFWLTWLVVACVVPAALAAAFLVVRSYARERTSLETSTIATTRTLARVVDQDLASTKAAMEVLAMSARLTDGNIESFRVIAREVLRANPGNGIVLTDTTGQQLMSTLRPYGEPLPRSSTPDLLRIIFETARPLISDLYIGATSERPQIAVGVPVVRDGKVIYGLTMGILPEHLGDLLRNQHLPPDWIVSILDSKGTIVARTHAPEQFVGTKGSAPLLRRMTEIPEDIMETNTVEGVPVLAIFSQSAISGWTVAIGIPTAALTADLRQSLLLNAAAAVLLLMLGIVLARTISRHISGSIRALTAPALALGGHGTPSISPSNITEVDALGQALVEAYRLIEQREGERDTAERGEREMLVAKRVAEAATEAAVRDIDERKRFESTLQEKNIQLQAAVDELDAFSYSVSHDLRAPLRAIDGFSHILWKEYGPALPDEGRDYLQLVRRNAGQMGHLVDDLLAFSRLGRQPLNKQQVTAATLIEQVVRDAKQQAEGRSVRVSVGETPACWGDPALLKQVFVNLVGNAFKYTRMRAEAVIEIGSCQVGGEQAFFVRDNGAGFDMEYADKLFGVFQRLHRTEDFEGTGVGLAIVQRIVQRHGGRVWAEAALDRGATFYFTMEVQAHG